MGSTNMIDMQVTKPEVHKHGERECDRQADNLPKRSMKDT